MKSILLIVDPQNDFITGSLAVEGAKEKMMKLADYINGDHPDRRRRRMHGIRLSPVCLRAGRGRLP